MKFLRFKFFKKLFTKYSKSELNLKFKMEFLGFEFMKFLGFRI